MIHYNISSNIILNKNESKETKNFFIYILIIAIFFGILFFIFGKKYYNKRKIRAEELENNFSYTYNYKINKFNLLEK
jgi:Kef-type K+ transport system membrane component KefB